MLVAAAALAFTSCNKTEVQSAPEGFDVTIVAGNPAVDGPTKTYIQGVTPYWKVGDQIGVVIRTVKDDVASWSNYKFTSDLKEDATTSTFSGTTELTGKYYAYYPYSGAGASDSGIKIDIPTEQKPGVGTFDGAADVLISTPFTVSGTKEIAEVRFTRATSVVKVVVNGIDELAGQNLKSFSITAAKDITGRGYFKPDTHEFTEIYYNKSQKVNATLGTGFAFGTKAPEVFFSVAPVTLEAGSDVVFEGVTEDYTISKTVTLTEDLPFEEAALVTINLTLAKENLAVKEKGLALPVADLCLWNTNTSGKDGSAEQKAEVITDVNGVNYVASATKVYMGPDYDMKLSSGSGNAVITTIPLDLSKAFNVSFLAAAWCNSTGTPDAASISVTIDNDPETTQTYDLSDEYETVEFEFEAATASSVITIEAVKRAYLTDLLIAAPGTEAPAGIAAPAEIKDVPAEGVADAEQAIYLKNASGWAVDVTPAGCVSSAMITGNNLLTYTVKANTSSDPATGTITIKLTKDSKTISKVIEVSQLAQGGIVLTPAILPTAYPTEEATVTSGDYTFDILNVANYGTGIQIKGNVGAYLANKTAIAKGIKTLVLKCHSTKDMYPSNLTVYAGTAEKAETVVITGTCNCEVDAESGKAANKGATVTYDFSGGNYTYFKILDSSKYAVYLESIEIKTK